MPASPASAAWGFSWDLPEEGGKEVPQQVKNDEEIAKFTVDEHLSEVERAVLYLNGGQLIQQRHAIANLPGILKGRGKSAFDTIAQPLKVALAKMDADAQVAAAEAFATITKERILSTVELQACVLPFITRNLNKERSEEETEAWLQTLAELIPALDKESLKTEVLSLALSKGDVEGNVGSKVLAAKIFGALAGRLTWEEIDRTFFKKALAMCQDVDFLVRVHMAQQLASICKAANKDVISKVILPELLELLRDEELKVREAALVTLVSSLDLVPKDVRKAQVLPVLRNHMQPLELDIILQRCVARVLGQMVTAIKGEFEQDDAQLFFGCYKHLAAKSDLELRRMCAAQLPAVLRAAAALNTQAFAQQFQDTFNNLAADADAEVRTTMAAHFHEVAAVVSRDCPSLLTKSLVRLLRDDVQAVQVAILPSLALTLQQWSVAQGEDHRRDAAVADIARALVELESRIARNWRLQQSLAAAFPCFPQVFSSDQIAEHFLPTVWRYLSSTAAAVRPTAAEGLAVFFRYNRRDKQRADMFSRVVRDLCRGKSFSARATFVEVAQHLLRRFSSRFAKDWLFELCLELLYDSVPNVRLAALALLPPLKRCIKLPEDVEQLERLNNAMSAVMTDNDRDVSQAARTMNEVFKKTPMRMGGSLDMIGSSGPSGDMDDKRKEEEEADMGFSPEDAKEIKADILQLAGAQKKALLTKGVSQRMPRLGADDSRRVSAPLINARPVLGSALTSAARRPGASEDGTGRQGPTQLGAVRPPASASATSRKPTGLGGPGASSPSPTSSPSSASASSSSVASKARLAADPARSSPTSSRAGSATTSASSATRASPLPPPSLQSSTAASGVRLPAINPRTGLSAGSATPLSAAKHSTASTASRLTTAGNKAVAISALSSARKTTR